VKPVEKVHFQEALLMNEYPTRMKERLSSLISEMSKSPALFVTKPGKDFTRNRKLTFETVVQLLISMGGNSVYKELLEAQGYDVNTATTSAFIQQRDKILPYTFEFLLHEFTPSLMDIKTYRGYRLFGVDGSDLHIPTNPDDVDTYFQTQPNAKGYNLMHLNAIYDLCNRLYIDAIIQTGRQQSEHRALADMVDRSIIKSKVIVIADRYYESYNDFAHIERKGWNYLIRVKDLENHGILSGLHLPSNGEFDICVQRILTRKQTKEVKAHLESYRYISSTATFDFLELRTEKLYPMSFRVVRFKIADDSYETVISNLDATDFPPDELKKLYAMRWGIETSFRKLKYTIGLIHFHAKKRAFIIQEIFARIIIYNFCEMITSHVVISQMDTKLTYQVNFTVAVLVCKHFLMWILADPPPDIESLIRKNILPIRPGRQNIRQFRPKIAVSFLYRVA